MGLMEIEMATIVQRERLAEAQQWRRRRDLKDRARQRREERRTAAGTRVRAPKADWPVFSLRIGGFALVAFRTVKIGPRSHLS
ncbi:hypothetical protein ABIB35_001752 [Arthrobacter sp. UYP6]|uniref:hypothetical protein n=1 Tax=Arthrobacter sp. UYP6 TaxID=1756378 RepID=UPI00339B2534